MKQNIKFLILVFALVATAAIIPKQAKAQQFGVSFQTFYDELSPYGEWIDYPKYGYVWIPDAGPDFVPYSTQGQWVYTEYGWTWVSNYEWGWAPFHYGRWDYDNYYGWLWVPDNQWGPSWVTWIQSDGYYGWQPMQPGISISLSFGRDYRTNYDHWTFVRDRDFERSDIQRYYVDQSDHDRIMQNYTVINQTYIDRSRNTTYISGPTRADVQRVTGTKVRPVAIQENNRPGQNLSNNRLRIYRPEVKPNTENGHQAVPTKVVDLKDVKRSSERNSPNQSRGINPANNNRNEQQRNAVTPQNQTRPEQPARQREVNSPVNKRRETQQRMGMPQNQNNQVQPAQQKDANPPVNKRQERQQRMVMPQNQSNQVQPAQQKDVNPPINKRQEQQQKQQQQQQQQQKTVTPQNQTRQVQPAQQRNVRPAGNNKPVKQTRAERQNTKRSKQSKETN